jgi:PAS domain S-box-containing protein
MRVLIIEDDAEQARRMQRTLERAGYVVDLAGTGDAGLALSEAGTYDVLLIDDQIPGPSGLEVLRTLATRGALPPTIMLTGHGDATLPVEALHLDASDYLLTDGDGRYLTLLPMVVARVLHQQSLLAEKRQAEEQFRALFEAAPDAMILVNADGHMVRVNAQVERLFGYARHEVLGCPVHLLVPERLRARHQQHLQGYCAAPSLRPMGSGLALYGRRKDGSEVPVEISLSPLQTAQGLLVVSAIRDVTARQEAERAQRAEEALRQHLEWLTTTLSSIGDAVLATDTAGTMTFLNPVAAHLTGWPAPDALGQPIATVLRLCHAQTHQVLEGLVQRVLCTGAIILLESETLLVTRHGHELPVRASAAPIRGLQGTPQGVVMVVRDISEYKALEDQLRHAQKIEAIGTLAGGIAHDFNNLLAAILGFTELALADVPQASALWHHLHQVLAAGTRAKDLVHQILAFSRKTLTARTPLTLPTLVQEALVLLRASLPSTITIRTHIAEEVGAVLADATQLHQVLLNLCANAAYAMRTTGGVLEVRLGAVEVKAPLAVVQATLDPGSYVQLTVRDTGQGMAPDVVERIFQQL